MKNKQKYEDKLDKAYNKQELNRRMRSLSPDNFFKYKDFHGAKPENFAESPTKFKPDLRRLYAQKCAGFESEFTRKVKSKKFESPFEWKMDAKTPERPFRDRFKFGNNKVSGKITIPTEENAFLAMTAYLNKQKKEKGKSMTLYPNKVKRMNVSQSSGNLQSRPDTWQIKSKQNNGKSC